MAAEGGHVGKGGFVGSRGLKDGASCSIAGPFCLVTALIIHSCALG